MGKVRSQAVNQRPGHSRWNVLITENRPHAPEHWTHQLCRLLAPQGVVSFLARSGKEALDLAQCHEIHAAVIDLGTPWGPVESTSDATAGPARTFAGDGGGDVGEVGDREPPLPFYGSGAVGRGQLRHSGGGLWWLELFGRLPARPPIVVVNSPGLSKRQLDRLLRESLRLGVFSVLNKPVGIEQLLVVFQRLMDRQYRGTWPKVRQDRLTQPPTFTGAQSQ